jgi:hypothetical protein
MKPSVRTILLAVVALIGVAVVVYFAVRAREAPVTPTENVPVTWEQARAAPMHAAHVGKEKIECTKCHAYPTFEK